MGGCHQWFSICRHGGQWFSDGEVALLRGAGDFIFRGMNSLAGVALHAKRARWKIIPKMHMLHHAHLLACRTHRNPVAQWAFCDESNMRVMSSVADKVHGNNVSRRSLERWLTRFFSDLDDDAFV